MKLSPLQRRVTLWIIRRYELRAIKAARQFVEARQTAQRLRDEYGL